MFFQAEDDIRAVGRSRGLGDEYKIQSQGCESITTLYTVTQTTLISTEDLQPGDLQMTIFLCLLRQKLAKFLQSERPLFWENMPQYGPSLDVIRFLVQGICDLSCKTIGKVPTIRKSNT